MGRGAVLGSFSNGGLGMGVSFTLEDDFSRNADVIERRMGHLSDYTDVISQKMSRSLDLVKVGSKLAVITASILTPFMLGVQHASDLEENINKVDVAFGKYADKVKTFSDTSIDNFGVDKIQALNAAALFGDMGTGMGLTQKAAADLSIQLTGLVGDLSSFKNIDHKMSQTALKGIFTGETESLKNIGIVMTQANLQTYLASKGIVKNFKDLSQTEKVMQRFNYVMEMSKNSIGDYIRTSDGYANSKRSMTGSIKELSATLGTILLPILAKTFRGIQQVVKGLNSFAKTNTGKYILGIVVALSGFLFIGGLTLILLGGLRVGIMHMASAFSEATKSTILQTIATKGYTAGLYKMAAATWAAIAPYAVIVIAITALILIAKKAWTLVNEGTEKWALFGSMLLYSLGIIGQIVLIIAGFTRGMKELNKPIEELPKSGILRFFTQFAAIVTLVRDVWKSWNGTTLTITDGLREKLEALGILEFARDVTDFVIRIRSFVDNMMKSLQPFKYKLLELQKVVKEKLLAIFYRLKNSFIEILVSAKKSFQPVIDLFVKLTHKIFGTNSSMGAWAIAGKVAGTIVLFILNKTVDVIIGLIKLIAGIAEAFIWLYTKLVKISNAIIGFFVSFGAVIVDSITMGVKDRWKFLKDFVKTSASDLADLIIDPISKAWNFVTTGGGLWGDSDDDSPRVVTPDNPVNPTVPFNIPFTGHHTNTSKNPIINFPAQRENPTPSNNTFVLQNIMDGDVISEKILDKQQLNDARNKR